MPADAPAALFLLGCYLTFSTSPITVDLVDLSIASGRAAKEIRNEHA